MKGILRAAPVLFALLATTACGDEIAEVLEGDLSCSSTPCEIRFSQTDHPRSTVQTIRFENIGNGDLEIESIRILDASPSIRFANSTVSDILSRTKLDWQVAATGQDWTVANNATIPLEPSQSIQIMLEFRPPLGNDPACPSGDPASCGILEIRTNARSAEGARVRANLAVSQNSGIIQITPQTVFEFPAPVPGRTESAQFQIRNIGQGDLLIEDVDIDLVQGLTVQNTSNLPLPLSLRAEEEAEYRIEWTYAADTPTSASIRIRHNDSTQTTQTLIVRFSTANPANLSVSPPSLELPETAAGETSESVFTLTNDGGSNLNVQSITLVDITPADVRGRLDVKNATGSSVIGTPFVILPNNNQVLTLSYSPLDERLVRGRIQIRSNDPDNGGVTEIPFTGGPPLGYLEVQSGQVFWSNVVQGNTESRSFVIRNVGRASFEVTSVTLTQNSAQNEFSIVTSPTTFTMGPGGAKVIEVQYARDPADTGTADQGQIKITTNLVDPGQNEVTINLIAQSSSSGLPPDCQIATSSDGQPTVGQPITFDATGSAANDGQLDANPFSWQLATPNGSSAQLSSLTDGIITLIPDQPGDYEVILQVTAQASGQLLRSQCKRTVYAQPAP